VKKSESGPSGSDITMTTPSHESVSAASGEPAAAGPGAPSPRAKSVRVRLALHFGVVLIVAGVGGGLLGGVPMAASGLLGVLLGGANLLFMRRITAALTGGGGTGWLLLLPFKMIALVGVAYALVAAKVAQPVPLAAGFALLPLSAIFLPRPRHPLESSSRVVYPATILPGRAGNH
jgi:hypothetical protein